MVGWMVIGEGMKNLYGKEMRGVDLGEEMAYGVV